MWQSYTDNYDGICVYSVEGGDTDDDTFRDFPLWISAVDVVVK